MSRRIIYVPFDHLNKQFGALKDADPKTDVVALIESARMTTNRPWNKQRLFFLISSARHFATQCQEDGFEVEYIKAATTIDGLKNLQQKFDNLPIVCAEPSSFTQYEQLKEFGVTFVSNDFFLTSRKDFSTWASKQKSFLMENFYRAQRVRLNILVNDGKPEAGIWNFDKENRLPPPKNYAWPPYLAHERDEIDREVSRELGIEPTDTWATTRAGALQQLDHFIKHSLANFGPYEDAVSIDSWSMHHSLLSPYLNIGLLHPTEVVEAVVAEYHAERAPIASVEALVRQVIGWREYINGMYWYLGPDYRFGNELNANKTLLPLFQDSSKTNMNCVQHVVADVHERAWTHHIPRLMILSNLALITGTNPIEFLDWMREQFIDASEWVMVPNVIGMGLHADGGTMMTKPYAAGGAYLSRMTQYCKGCTYDPKLRVGETACPFTTLYWDFLDRHKEEFVKNHRMSQQVNGLKRLSDLPELKIRAQEVLIGLDQGRI